MHLGHELRFGLKLDNSRAKAKTHIPKAFGRTLVKGNCQNERKFKVEALEQRRCINKTAS